MHASTDLSEASDLARVEHGEEKLHHRMWRRSPEGAAQGVVARHWARRTHPAVYIESLREESATNAILKKGFKYRGGERERQGCETRPAVPPVSQCSSRKSQNSAKDTTPSWSVSMPSKAASNVASSSSGAKNDALSSTALTRRSLATALVKCSLDTALWSVRVCSEGRASVTTSLRNALLQHAFIVVARCVWCYTVRARVHVWCASYLTCLW